MEGRDLCFVFLNFLTVFFKAMTAKEKKRFEDMAIEKAAEVGGGKGKGKKKKKDPNAPKRSL